MGEKRMAYKVTWDDGIYAEKTIARFAKPGDATLYCTMTVERWEREGYAKDGKTMRIYYNNRLLWKYTY